MNYSVAGFHSSVHFLFPGCPPPRLLSSSGYLNTFKTQPKCLLLLLLPGLGQVPSSVVPLFSCKALSSLHHSFLIYSFCMPLFYRKAGAGAYSPLYPKCMVYSRCSINSPYVMKLKVWTYLYKVWICPGPTQMECYSMQNDFT